MTLPRHIAAYLRRPDISPTGSFAPDDRRMSHVLTSEQRHDPARPTVALLGVPQDIGVARNGGRTGAATAPEAVRRALYKFTPFAGDVHLCDRLNLIDLGDLVVDGLELEDIHKRQQKVVAFLVAAGVIPVVVGGGHDIARPDAAGFGAVHAEFGVVNIDPHTDVRPLIDGARAHSGSPFRQMLEDERLTVPRGAFVEFGIQRFAVAQSHIDYVLGKGMAVMWYHDVRRKGFDQAFREALRQASNDGARPLFVSFDMDSVRSADAPGVSATAPIGFSGDEICEAAMVCGASPFVGMIDLAEVNPTVDVDGRTARLAALLLMHFFAGVAQRPGGTDYRS